MNPQGREITTETCGCQATHRRVCDVCRTGSHVFLACSLRCLRHHQTTAHGGGDDAADADMPTDTQTRMRQAQREMNRHAPVVWQRYAGHRAHLMSRIPSPSVARSEICVFGAGSCSDIDLADLATRFAQIHLVDLDGSALERARDAQPSEVRQRLVLHGEIDLSGFLGHLDDWAENFPSQAELGQAAVMAAHAIVRGLGRPFDVTVSACVLSQLIQPFQSAWILSDADWAALEAGLTGVHLATMAGATRVGGQGFVAFDVASSDDAPELAQMLEAKTDDASALQSLLDEKLARQALQLRPDPENLLTQLKSPGLGSLFASPTLTVPWLWDIGTGIQLVYGLNFQRR